MAKRKTSFQCTECGWSTLKWAGRCGGCQQWGTIETQVEGEHSSPRFTATQPTGESAAQPITAFAQLTAQHRSSGVGELDRVLGGGIVPGAVILLSGEPGVGKSTLLLDVAAQRAQQSETVLYVTGEESTAQVRLRAERTGAMHDTLYLVSETNVERILGHIHAVQPSLVIVDSIQTLHSSNIEHAAGGPAQVRESASALIHAAKTAQVAIVLVGHVTKDGTIAGPRVLEHLVDVVCHFEGDAQTSLRFLRALKNRYGATGEIGCFAMEENGIAEIPDPSQLFLARSASAVSGTCVTITAEGQRMFPVEIQALVVPSAYPNPKRITSGVSASRVAMILAVLERHLGAKVSDSDVYIATVGGISVTEPAADTAIALAILSSLANTPLPHDLAAVGEISLAGEIRPVVGAEQREREAQRLGYSKMIDARANTIETARHWSGLSRPELALAG